MIDYIKEVEKIKVNKSGQLVALHKPILLLFTISEVARGHENRFYFDEIENTLKDLLIKYGLRNSKSVKPEYPFIYLASSKAIWHCAVDKRTLRHPNSVTRNELLGKTAGFNEGFYSFIKEPNNANKLIKYLLQSYWPEAYYEDILSDIGFGIGAEQIISSKAHDVKLRGRKFVEDVMDAYERKCAICHQSIRLGDALIGIDACHLKPIQHFGDDHVSNGIALCKIHHWALDRGAFTISDNNRVIVSPKLNGNKIEEFFTVFENNEIFIPRNDNFKLNKKNIEYHYSYIFLK